MIGKFRRNVDSFEKYVAVRDVRPGALAHKLEDLVETIAAIAAYQLGFRRDVVLERQLIKYALWALPLNEECIVTVAETAIP